MTGRAEVIPSLLTFRRRMDDEILRYAAKRLSEIRPEASPNREEGAAERQASGGAEQPSPGVGLSGAEPRAELFDARYHVPRSQVWEGSRGRQRGYVHLHVRGQFDLGRIHRKPGDALCGRNGWYERAPEGEAFCPRCLEISARVVINHDQAPEFAQ